MAKPAKQQSAEVTEAPTSKALALIETVTIEKAPAIFGKNDLNRFVEAVRAEVIDEVPDLSTDKGRKRIASVAATVARSKTAVEGVGRAYLKQLKDIPKVIEKELREFEAAMNEIRDQVRKPLTEYENAETARKDAIEDAIQGIVDLGTLHGGENSIQIRQKQADLEALIINAETYQERLEEAEQKRKFYISAMAAPLAKAQTDEHNAAEHERLRKELAARDEQDRIREAAAKAVEEERQRAAQQQQAQRDEDARKLREADERAQRAEQGRQAVERQAQQERDQAAQREEQARLQERQRQEQETAEQKRLDDERAANRAHCGAINKAALDALMLVNMSGPDQEASYMSAVEAKAIIAAIVRGQIPAVAITY